MCPSLSQEITPLAASSAGQSRHALKCSTILIAPVRGLFRRQAQSMITPYMQRQTDINERMRSILNDWLIEVRSGAFTQRMPRSPIVEMLEGTLYHKFCFFLTLNFRSSLAGRRYISSSSCGLRRSSSHSSSSIDFSRQRLPFLNAGGIVVG